MSIAFRLTCNSEKSEEGKGALEEGPEPCIVSSIILTPVLMSYSLKLSVDAVSDSSVTDPSVDDRL